MTRTWTEMLLEQLTFHWDHQLRPRLEGLTDDELALADLVLHIHRELIHHGAEASLLRDLHEHQETR